MITFSIISAIALAYCAYHGACIVRVLRGESAARKTRRSRLSLASLLSLSRTLEVAP